MILNARENKEKTTSREGTKHAHHTDWPAEDAAMVDEGWGEELTDDMDDKASTFRSVP
jgi:hypothetical protein